MKTRRTWRPLLALFAAALVAAVGLAPKTAWAAGEVAQVGEQKYETMDEAIGSANGGTVVLLGNVSDVVIPADTTVTIDLNGCNITSNSSHAVTNNGNLTIVGEGTVDGGATSGRGALYNSPTGSATLNGGTYSGGKWYVIKNLGELTINGGSTLIQNDAGSSGIDNGYYGNLGNDCQVPYPSSADVQLTITGGTFSGGMNVVKNDDFGTLVIGGGTFSNTNGPTVLNWHKATINGGEFTVNEGGWGVLANGFLSQGADAGELTVTGGTFKASSKGVILTYPQNNKPGGTTTITGGDFTGVMVAPNDTNYSSLPKITGGTFSSDVSEFLPENVEQNGDGTIVERPVVATIGENKYYSLESALADAKANDTITLQQDVELDAHLAIKTSGITLNLNEKTISASDSFADASGVDAQLLGIEGADNVTIENGTLKAGKTNTHTLNIWNADGITLRNLTLDNAATKGGAPLIVGASDATLEGTVEFFVGPKSWYAANVDSRYLGANNTDPKSGSLKTAEETVLVFNGTGDSLANGICIENTAADDKTTSTVTFGKNSAIVSPDVENFKPVYLHENNETPANDAVIDPGNAGLAINDEGEVIQLPFVTFVVDGHAIKMLNADASGKIDFAPVYEAIDKNIPDGMVFDGWYTDEDFTKTFDPNKPITEDTTLYGRFVPTPVETVTITFMYGDKVYAEAEAPLNGSIPTDKIPADPTWEGHTFAGWYAKINEDGSVVEDSKVDLATAKFGSDATLYAGFVANDEGGVTTTPDSGEKTDGKKTETLAQTSDPTTFLPAIVAGAAGVTTVAGAAVLRKRQR